MICPWFRCSYFTFSILWNMTGFLIRRLRPNHILSYLQNICIIETFIAFIKSSKNKHLSFLNFTGWMMTTRQGNITGYIVFIPLKIFLWNFKSINIIGWTDFSFAIFHYKTAKENESSIYFKKWVSNSRSRSLRIRL